MAVPEAVNVFDARNPDLLYLAPITIAYIFSQSGDLLYFYLAVVALVAAKLLKEAIEYARAEKGQEEMGFQDTSIFEDSGVHVLYRLTFLVAGVIWFILMVWSYVLLYQFFTSADLIIVGLSVIYGGLLVYFVIMEAVKQATQRWPRRRLQ